MRVEAAGFCHSDIHVIDGEIQVLPRMPLTLGHENAGIVHDVGDGVTAVREGDPVAVFGGWGCGRCDYCVTGHEQLCEAPEWAGLSMHDGGYAEYLLVPHERYLVKLFGLTPAVAAPLTDAALTPYRAVRKALPFLQADHPVGHLARAHDPGSGPAPLRPIVHDRFDWAMGSFMAGCLLDVLPALPDDLQFRFVNRDLVLVDIDADLVIDVLPDALPPADSWARHPSRASRNCSAITAR